MANKTDLVQWVEDAVRDHDGTATVVEVAAHIWDHHEQDLRESGTLFYTWQYDMRWAAQRLRDEGVFKDARSAAPRRWELAGRD